MNIKEFSLKTSLFILLPAFIIYTCSQVQERVAIGQAACRQCVESLGQPGVTKLTLAGYADTLDFEQDPVRKSITDPYALRQINRLVRDSRPVRVRAAMYRVAPRWYRVILSRGQDTCQVEFYKTRLGLQLLTSFTPNDSAFEVPHFLPIADSLFGTTPVNPGMSGESTTCMSSTE